MGRCCSRRYWPVDSARPKCLDVVTSAVASLLACKCFTPGRQSYTHLRGEVGTGAPRLCKRQCGEVLQLAPAPVDSMARQGRAKRATRVNTCALGDAGKGAEHRTMPMDITCRQQTGHSGLRSTADGTTGLPRQLRSKFLQLKRADQDAAVVGANLEPPTASYLCYVQLAAMD